MLWRLTRLKVKDLSLRGLPAAAASSTASTATMPA
jgi:hypothetical protein